MTEAEFVKQFETLVARYEVEYLRADLVSVRAELRNIAEAKRFDRERFDDDMAFADWAQSRARHALDLR